MHKTLFLSAAFAITLAATPLSVSAQKLNQREPGLWELSVERESDLGQLMQGIEAMLGQLPPEQREQMKEMMQQSALGPSGRFTRKQCLTPEEAAVEFQPDLDDSDMQCEQKLNVVSATEANYTFSCTDGSERWHGEGRVWGLSGKQYQSKLTLAGKADGQPVKVSTQESGRWLGADCQGVAPDID